MTKISCAVYAVDTIRKIRKNPPNLDAGTKAGVQMHRLWAVVSKRYSEQEFRLALGTLLQEGVLFSRWETCVWIDKNSAGYSYDRKRRVASIPKEMDLSDHWWCRHGEAFIPVEERGNYNHYQLIRRFMFYVKDDGLPRSTLRRKKKK